MRPSNIEKQYYGKDGKWHKETIDGETGETLSDETSEDGSDAYDRQREDAKND